MVSWNLSQMISKVRNLTGTPIDPDGGSQLSDSDITNYINTYYSFTMPFELKEQVTFQKLEFFTEANQPTYAFPGNSSFLTNSPVAYVNGFPLVYYEDRDIFLRDFPEQFAQDSIATGDGITTIYSGTAQGFPVLQGTFFISDGSQVAHDVANVPPDGTGTLAGDASGTINYVTGVWTATFTVAPALGTTIIDNYVGYIATQPQGILFYADTSTNPSATDKFLFDIRPVPDQVYKIELQGYITQDQFTNSSDAPLLTEWGQVIAYGAALEIFADRGDIVAYNNLYPIFKRYENVALNRFVEQLDSQRSLQRF